MFDDFSFDFDDLLDWLVYIFSFEWIADLWEGFLDFLSFDWIPDVWDFIIGVFSLGEEFSIAGLVFGFAAALLDWLLRGYLITPFTSRMSPTSAFIMTISTLGACLIAGYLIGRKMFDD